MEKYTIISKIELQQLIIANLRLNLADTINVVQFHLLNENKFIKNQDIIDEMGYMLSDEQLLNNISIEKQISVSELISRYFNEVNPLPIILPFEGQTPLLTNVFIGNIGNGVHLECDVFLVPLVENIAETQLRVRYYKDGIEDVSKLSSCSLIADDGGGLLFPNPLYGQEGQPEFVGDYTLAMIYVSLKMKQDDLTFWSAFKQVAVLMIRISLQRIIQKCGYV